MAGKKQKPKSKADSSRITATKPRELSEAQKETLKANAFPPGNNANPGGRPKTSVFRTAFLKVLDKPIPGDSEGRTYADAIAEKMVTEAVKGKIDAVRELADRVDGKPVQALTHGGEGGGPIPVELRSPEEIKARLAELIAKATVKDGKRSPKAR